MNSNTTLPVNLGNPEEYSIKDFAIVIRDLVGEFWFLEFLYIDFVFAGSGSKIINQAKQEDDPQQRRPDITRAAQLLNWKPKISMRDGLKKTIEYFRNELEVEKARVK